jgi:hypothetical protein
MGRVTAGKVLVALRLKDTALSSLSSLPPEWMSRLYSPHTLLCTQGKFVGLDWRYGVRRKLPSLQAAKLFGASSNFKYTKKESFKSE